MWRRKHAIEAEAADAGAGGGGGGSTVGDGAGGAGSASTGAASGEGGAPSLLASGATAGVPAGNAGAGAAGGAPGAAAPTVDPATGRPSDVPEKFWDAEKKALRQDALLRSYSDLEKRLGEPRPAKPEDYKADAAIKAAKDKGLDTTLDPEMAAAFAKEAHEAGLSQKQYEFVMSKYFEQIEAVAETMFQNSMDAATKALEKVWPGEQKKAELASAYRAFMHFAPKDLRTDEAMNAIGNNPTVLRVLAAIGKEVAEDKSLRNGGSSAEDIVSLQKSEAYWNAKHPDHESTVRKVNEYYARGGRNPMRPAA